MTDAIWSSFRTAHCWSTDPVTAVPNSMVKLPGQLGATGQAPTLGCSYGRGARRAHPTTRHRRFVGRASISRRAAPEPVKLKKDRVRVHAVAEGSEDRLHQFLEGVVLQANATHEEVHSSAREDRDADEHEAGGPDAAMTERFRSFARAPDD